MNRPLAIVVLFVLMIPLLPIIKPLNGFETLPISTEEDYLTYTVIEDFEDNSIDSWISLSYSDSSTSAYLTSTTDSIKLKLGFPAEDNTGGSSDIIHYILLNLNPSVSQIYKHTLYEVSISFEFYSINEFLGHGWKINVYIGDSLVKVITPDDITSAPTIITINTYKTYNETWTSSTYHTSIKLELVVPPDAIYGEYQMTPEGEVLINPSQYIDNIKLVFKYSSGIVVYVYKVVNTANQFFKDVILPLQLDNYVNPKFYYSKYVLNYTVVDGIYYIYFPIIAPGDNYLYVENNTDFTGGSVPSSALYYTDFSDLNEWSRSSSGVELLDGGGVHIQNPSVYSGASAYISRANPINCKDYCGLYFKFEYWRSYDSGHGEYIKIWAGSTNTYYYGIRDDVSENKVRADKFYAGGSSAFLHSAEYYIDAHHYLTASIFINKTFARGIFNYYTSTWQLSSTITKMITTETANLSVLYFKVYAEYDHIEDMIVYHLVSYKSFPYYVVPIGETILKTVNSNRGTIYGGYDNIYQIIFENTENISSTVSVVVPSEYTLEIIKGYLQKYGDNTSSVVSSNTMSYSSTDQFVSYTFRFTTTPVSGGNLQYEILLLPGFKYTIYEDSYNMTYNGTVPIVGYYADIFKINGFDVDTKAFKYERKYTMEQFSPIYNYITGTILDGDVPKYAYVSETLENIPNNTYLVSFHSKIYPQSYEYQSRMKVNIAYAKSEEEVVNDRLFVDINKTQGYTIKVYTDTKGQLSSASWTQYSFVYSDMLTYLPSGTTFLQGKDAGVFAILSGDYSYSYRFSTMYVRDNRYMFSFEDYSFSAIIGNAYYILPYSEVSEDDTNNFPNEFDSIYLTFMFSAPEVQIIDAYTNSVITSIANVIGGRTYVIKTSVVYAPRLIKIKISTTIGSTYEGKYPYVYSYEGDIYGGDEFYCNQKIVQGTITNYKYLVGSNDVVVNLPSSYTSVLVQMFYNITVSNISTLNYMVGINARNSIGFLVNFNKTAIMVAEGIYNTTSERYESLWTKDNITNYFLPIGVYQYVEGNTYTIGIKLSYVSNAMSLIIMIRDLNTGNEVWLKFVRQIPDISAISQVIFWYYSNDTYNTYPETLYIDVYRGDYIKYSVDYNDYFYLHIIGRDALGRVIDKIITTGSVDDLDPALSVILYADIPYFYPIKGKIIAVRYTKYNEMQIPVQTPSYINYNPTTNLTTPNILQGEVGQIFIMLLYWIVALVLSRTGQPLSRVLIATSALLSVISVLLGMNYVFGMTITVFALVVAWELFKRHGY